MSMLSARGSTSGEAMLSAAGPPGVEIQIIDGRYHILERGTEKIERLLPQGVYLVRWLAPEKLYEEIIRLLPTPSGLHVSFPGELPWDVAAENSPGALYYRASEAPAAHQQHESDIVVLERTEQREPSSSIAKGLRLYNRDEVAMRSDKASVEAAGYESLDASGALRVYHVPAGNYRLRFESSSGLTVDQTIGAIEGRRTLVFLCRESAETLIASGDRFERRMYGGIDPSATVLVTVPIRAPAHHGTDELRMAEILLQALAWGGDPLDANMLKRLYAPDADPLLRLYTAGLIISQLARKNSPALSDPYPTSAATGSHDSAVRAFELKWRDEAGRLIKSIAPADCLPDLFAFRWELGEADFGELTAPPLLAIGWECAAKHSTRVAGAVPNTASFRAASRGRVAAGPWLAWRASAAKEGMLFSEDKVISSDNVSDAASLFSAELEIALPESLGSSNILQVLDTLSPTSRAVVVTALDLKRGPKTPTLADTVENLAGALLTPAVQLKEKLQTASKELANATAKSPRLSVLQPSDPPPLRRPIMHLDDPQKGRFGGKSKDAGFEMTARFAETTDSDWVGITLVVTADPGVRQAATKAEFFLHDSFARPRITKPFVEGHAELTLQAFGGFTVGVWIQSHGVQLELDLAALPDAPRIVKEW